ncbi:ribonuclease H-like domain-containing protein [Tuber borchii]|uniref:Ribonuclease H-like domain-containing protein n=1 Tax=Tuber borchii TaxID=42251 RepID=A0A2T6ZFM8_TUBBO|nr:ribonuclease H-like domain-containing protein [Tuber borchii]
MAPKASTPLVWIDCEMTGLDPSEDVILQIYCYITDHELNLLDEEGYETVVHYEKEVLNTMGDWCQKTHSSTGLIARVLESTVTVAQATEGFLAYIKKWLSGRGVAFLAGNSVHHDRAFLPRYYTSVADHLHHRIIDVSTVKEAVRMWCFDEVHAGVPAKKLLHEARMDILESIEELRYYKGVILDGK